MGRIRISASFSKKCTPRGSVRVRTPPRGSVRVRTPPHESVRVRTPPRGSVRVRTPPHESVRVRTPWPTGPMYCQQCTVCLCWEYLTEQNRVGTEDVLVLMRDIRFSFSRYSLRCIHTCCTALHCTRKFIGSLVLTQCSAVQHSIRVNGP